MAISNQLFKAPIPETYDPSRAIERSFQQTGDLVTKAMTQESERLQQERANFNEMYANIGELDAQLQENYAGMQQQMVTSTKDWLKEQIKKGVSTNDPELVRELSQRTGRIKASMSNADRNRKQLDEVAKLLKEDPTIRQYEKGIALQTLMTYMNDPDFLISKNPFDAREFLDKFVDPQLTFLEAAKQVPSGGSFEDVFIDERGNQKLRKTAYTNLVNKENPFNADGSLNVSVPPDVVQAVKDGEYGNRILQQAKKIADERYSNLPVDKAFEAALTDGFSMAIGNQTDVKVYKTAEQLRREQQQADLQNQRMRLAINKEERIAQQQNAQGAEQEEMFDMWNKFVDSYESADNAILGEYNTKGYKDVKWVSPKDIKEYKEISDQKTWNSLSKDRRVEILSSLAGEENIPTTAAGLAYDTKTEEARKIALEAFLEENPDLDTPVGIQYSTKQGREDGMDIWGKEIIPVNNESDLENAFRTLENIRRSGQRKVVPSVVPEDPNVNIEEDLDYADIWQ